MNITLTEECKLMLNANGPTELVLYHQSRRKEAEETNHKGLWMMMEL